MKIDVTIDDMRAGRQMCTHCAIAVAVERALDLPSEAAQVGNVVGRTKGTQSMPILTVTPVRGGGAVHFQLPEEARVFALAYDDARDEAYYPEPISFEVPGLEAVRA